MVASGQRRGEVSVRVREALFLFFRYVELNRGWCFDSEVMVHYLAGKPGLTCLRCK